MKKIQNFTVKKEKEFATLFQITDSEFENPITIWLPNSKFEIIDDILEIDEPFWEEKRNEILNPVIESVTIIVSEDSQISGEKSLKIILDAEIKSINIKPFLFIPNSIILEEKKLEENNNINFHIKIPLWFWEKTLPIIIEGQLEFFNREKEDADKFQKKDFKLLTEILE